MADAKLLAQIQETLDQIDLKVSRDEAKGAIVTIREEEVVKAGSWRW